MKFGHLRGCPQAAFQISEHMVQMSLLSLVTRRRSEMDGHLEDSMKLTLTSQPSALVDDSFFFLFCKTSPRLAGAKWALGERGGRRMRRRRRVESPGVQWRLSS